MSELINNDIVKINTSKTSKGPSKEWLNIVKSTQTKNKIRAFFTKNEKEIYIERGRDFLEKELRKRKIVFNEFFTNDNLNKIFKELKIDNQDELYLEVGNGKHSANTVVNIIYKKEEVIKPKKIIEKVEDNDSDIVVAGIDKVKVNLANCCSPIPGDEIIGYITKGNGISVHRRNCHNLEYLDNRTVNVEWGNSTNDKYETSFLIHTKTVDNKVMDIMHKLGMFDVRVNSFLTLREGDETVYEVTLYIRNLEYLNKLFLEIQKLSYVDKIVRLTR